MKVSGHDNGFLVISPTSRPCRVLPWRLPLLRRHVATWTVATPVLACACALLGPLQDGAGVMGLGVSSELKADSIMTYTESKVRAPIADTGVPITEMSR